MRIVSAINSPKKQMGRVLSKVLLAEKVYEVDIMLPEVLIYRPGKYISLKVSESGIRRSYSVVGFEKNVVKLLVDVGPGGVGSVFVENLSVNDEVEVMGFLGNFFLDWSELGDKKTVYFVATGSGIAPFLPMIREIRNRNPELKVVLWWGVRFVRRVYWQDKLKELKNNWSNFNFEIYVSRPESEWSGNVGRVGDKLDEVETNDTSWYLCGSTEMIEQIKNKLLAKGVGDVDINYEKFF